MPARPLLAALPLLALGACGLLGRGGREGGGAAPGPAAQQQQAAAVPMPMAAALAGVASPVSGEARLLPGATAAEVRATVSIRNSLVGLAHPWAVRAGRCGESGARRGTPEHYAPLEVRPDGTAEATATLPFAMPIGAAHSVTVMRSRSDSTVIACGVLAPGA